MTTLAIDELKPGMVVAEAVRNHQDQLLLDAGRKVTAKNIRVFKSWGIRRVAVRSAALGANGIQGSTATAPPATLDESLRARFADVLHDPLMMDIMQAAGRQLANRQPRKKARNGRG
jgi:hypothetical protein